MNAVLGGTFDPVHDGHLHLAKILLSRFPLEKLFFVPNARNPLKSEGPTATGEQRLAMLRLAIADAGERRCEVLDWEVRRPPPSYTITTIEQMSQTFGAEIALVLGNEVFAELPRWHRPRDLASLCNLVVVRRAPALEPDVHGTLSRVGIADAHPDPAQPNRLRYLDGKRWVQVETIDPLPFSATTLREALARAPETAPQGIGRSVWQYIKENGLYAVRKKRGH